MLGFALENFTLVQMDLCFWNDFAGVPDLSFKPIILELT